MYFQEVETNRFQRGVELMCQPAPPYRASSLGLSSTRSARNCCAGRVVAEGTTVCLLYKRRPSTAVLLPDGLEHLRSCPKTDQLVVAKVACMTLLHKRCGRVRGSVRVTTSQRTRAWNSLNPNPETRNRRRPAGDDRPNQRYLILRRISVLR